MKARALLTRWRTAAALGGGTWRFANTFGLEEAELRDLTARLQEVIRWRGHDAVIIAFDPNLPADIDSAGRDIKLLATCSTSRRFSSRRRQKRPRRPRQRRL